MNRENRLEMAVKPLFTSHEKRCENVACRRVMLAAHGRAREAFASESCQCETWLQGCSRFALTWFVDQFDETLDGRVFITPIHSFCASCKPEWIFEVGRVESRKLPVYY